MVKQSPNDNKRYQCLTLSNGLRALLVHNHTSNKAAAALAVNVGHFDDPDDRQGLAHFLEHMLFLGTEKYPEGGEYQQFINQHGGQNNAWTATEHTCFFFDIKSEYFSAALERFSQFFISPLLSQEFVDKERKNVDAEFKLKLKDDIRRLYDVHKETVNPKHPFAKFSVGSELTLADRPESCLTTEVKTFFSNHYQAQFMTLVLEGPQSLEELADLAQHHFNDIQSNQQEKPPISVPLYQSEHLQKWLRVHPVKNDQQLIISFAMPAIDQYYQNKPESILAYLLGHEGPGSILSLLKKQQWALSLTAGSGINGSNFKDFNINIALTPEGEKHQTTIISYVFSYIELLKQSPISTVYFQEKRALSDLAFTYQEKLSPLDSVSHLVINMQHYPASDYIYGDYMMAALDQSQLDHLLSFLEPENMRLISISSDFKRKTHTKVSHWYQVPYTIDAIGIEQMKQWQLVTLHADLHLPDENNYIVAQPSMETITDKELDPPQLIEQQSGLNVWFKQDTSFNSPKGYIYIAIDAPITIKNTDNIAMTRLFIDLFTDDVNEKFYNAELAGIHYHLYSHQGGMTLQLSGISCKQLQLLENLLIELTNLAFKKEKFELFKQQLINHWQNGEKSKSISQLFSALSSSMQPNNPSSSNLISALTAITFEQFSHFNATIFDKVSIEAFMHGNWLLSSAQEMSYLLEQHFNEKLEADAQTTPACIDIQGQGEITIPLLLAEHDHAAVIYFPMQKKDLTTIAFTMLTSQLLSPLFFQEMRTEKQYGYLVGVGFIPINRYPGIAFYIQSPHSHAQELIDAMSKFIQQVQSYVANLAQESWQHLQLGLASQLAEKDTSLRIKSQRYWSAINNHEASFFEKQKLISIIKQLKKDDLSTFLQQQVIDFTHVDHLKLVTCTNETDYQHQLEKQGLSPTMENFFKKMQRKY